LQLRKRLFQQFDPEAYEGSGLSPLNQIVLSVVLISIIVAIVETEPSIQSIAPRIFKLLTAVFAICFTIEYVLRLWAMGEKLEYEGLTGRLRYAGNLFALFDLIATITLWLDLFGVFGSAYGILFRLARALKVLSLARGSIVATAIQLLWKAIKTRYLELSLSFGATIIILIVAATLLYIVEGESQPEAFGSIPRAMWWATATLTTVGYGDVYPVTPFGKILAGVVALTSIALVAMPAGIMAAAFSDAFQDLHKEKQDKADDAKL